MDKRKSELLKVIIETYIKDVHPIGSKSLCKRFKCSSATIRNEMSELEADGYLEKTHLSSGRIPSENGYKYYVENLMIPKDLRGDDIIKLQQIFNNKSLVIPDAISKCMEIISDITNCTSIVLGKSSSDNKLKQVNVIPLDESKLVALICTDKGFVENKQFILPPDVKMTEVVNVCDIINKLLVGSPINEINAKLEFEIKPIISKRVKQYQVIYDLFLNAFNDFSKNDVALIGQSNLLKQPEYNDINKIKKLVDKLEDENIVEKMKEDEQGINVYIGKDTKFDEDVTVIKSKYKIDGQEGIIAVVGPKRMEYDRIISLLKYLNDQIGNGENDGRK